MAIPEIDFYHGAALHQIIDLPEFTSINRDPHISGSSYIINHNVGLFIKHSTAAGPWAFTFTKEHQEQIRRMFERYREKAFLALICKDIGVCLLTYGEYRKTVNERFLKAEGIKVEKPERGGFRVNGSKGRIGVIPLNRYPRLLFE